MLYRNSLQHEIGKLTIFNYLYSLNLKEHKEKYHTLKPTETKFLFKIEDSKIYLCG